MGYYTQLHLCVSKWNKQYSTAARVQCDSTNTSCVVVLSDRDWWIWSFTWHSMFPQLADYTTLAEET